MHFIWGFGPQPTTPETLQKLESIERRLDGIQQALRRAREENMAQTAAVQRLVTEVAETKGKIASMLTFQAGIPELIRQAVADALAANPSLSAEDLAAITAAADDLDASQAEIAAALDANAGSEGGTEPTPETPAEPSGPVEPAPVVGTEF